MALNFLITAVELIGGIAAGSLALISDALHNFSDGVSLILSYVALRLSSRPRNQRYTFGLKRTQILAAVINAGVLLAICLVLGEKAIEALFNPAPVAGRLMLVVALVGLAANLAGTWLLHRDARNNLNLRSSYLHLLSDAVSSAAVVLGALAIEFFQLYWVDPLLTLLIVLYVIKECFDLLRDALRVLLLRVPVGIDLDAVQQTVEAHPAIHQAHHLHLWQVDDQDIHFEAHLLVDDLPLSATCPLVVTIEEQLLERFGINHVTLQFETGECASRRQVK
jgi:cobalt-zinc-cadmium efflux system protein